MKNVTLSHTGQSVDVKMDDLLPGNVLHCQIWEGTDEIGEPVKFVVCGYIVTERNLPAPAPLDAGEEK